jgi:transposase
MNALVASAFLGASAVGQILRSAQTIWKGPVQDSLVTRVGVGPEPQANKEPVMDNGTTYVGLDTSKETIHVAVLWPGTREAATSQVANDPAAVRRLVRKLLRESGEGKVVMAYEAGPCGYALQRQIEALGVRCLVVAPSLIPKKPGERIKTDRRDARKLVQYLRAGQLTEVQPPSLEQEAARDLVRCREDLLEDRARIRHRIGKMMLRRGLGLRSPRAWTQAHRRWLRTLHFEHACEQAVLDDYLLALEQAEERLAALDAEIARLAATAPYRDVVGALACFRGVKTLTAMTLVCELHNPQRFLKPRALMAFLGLVPSEYSSAERRHQGSITKTGNAHVRRVLVEAVHSYRHRPAVGPGLRKRREGQPAWAIALADKAQSRLHRRYQALLYRGKPYGTVMVALARELTGFLWAAFMNLQNVPKAAA